MNSNAYTSKLNPYGSLWLYLEKRMMTRVRYCKNRMVAYIKNDKKYVAVYSDYLKTYITAYPKNV